MLLTCIAVFSMFSLSAQTPRKDSGADGLLKIQPLKIGDTIPESLWMMPLQVVNHPEGKDTVRLNDYRDKKLIVLDFWATWCGSCIAAMPHLDKIEKEFNNSKIAIIPITYEEKSHVVSFIKNNSILRKLNKKSIVNDHVLKNVFPHRLIPHYIWIDHTGRVIHATDANSVTSENISKVLNNETITVEVKNDHMTWDENMPILLDNSYSQLLFRSVLLGIDKGYPSRQNILHNNRENKLRLYALNRPIRSLYELAYLFPAVYHPSKLVFNNDNILDIDKQLYCYEIEMTGNDTAKLFLHMQKELDLHFGINSSILEEEKWCWVLKKYKTSMISNAIPFHNLSDEKRDKTILKGQHIYLLVSILAKVYNDLPFLNETDIKHTMDIELPIELSNPVLLNVKLSKYGLALTKEKRKVKILYLTQHQVTK